METDWVVRVVRVDQREIIGRNGELIMSLKGLDRGPLDFGKRKKPDKLFRMPDRMLRLPSPVVPVTLRDVRPCRVAAGSIGCQTGRLVPIPKLDSVGDGDACAL